MKKPVGRYPKHYLMPVDEEDSEAYPENFMNSICISAPVATDFILSDGEPRYSVECQNLREFNEFRFKIAVHLGVSHKRITDEKLCAYFALRSETEKETFDWGI